MTSSLNFIIALILSTFLSIGTFANPVLKRAIEPVIDGVTDMSPRSANTCADPSLARTILQGFSGAVVAHSIAFHWVFVDSDSLQGAGPPGWVFQGPVFKAWPAQQPFTVPLFRLVTPTASDFIFVVGADAQTPPVVSGFSTSTANIVAWVYNTAVCGSVPVMSAVLAAQSDHYYTTDPEEHAALLANGWTDGGVIAFALPLPSM